jgi:uncharacterized protein VirK/YbjX
MGMRLWTDQMKNTIRLHRRYVSIQLLCETTTKQVRQNFMLFNEDMLNVNSLSYRHDNKLPTLDYDSSCM